MVVVITQPNYIPWKGYFDLIDRADIFVWLDDVQYTARDWRNRNRIKTSNGIKWLTIPVDSSTHKLINQTKIKYNNDWIKKHLHLLYHSYRNCPHFTDAYNLLEKHLSTNYKDLSQLDIDLSQSICNYLGISTKFYISSHLNIKGVREELFINICRHFGADTYLTGPSASNYIDPLSFKSNQIELKYIEYSYGTYHQPHGEFRHDVSILDTICCLGKNTLDYIRNSKVALYNA